MNNENRMPITELRKIQGYNDIKEYLYKRKEQATTKEESKIINDIIYELYETDIGLCSWIE